MKTARFMVASVISLAIRERVMSYPAINVEAAHVAVNNIANFEKVNFHLNNAAVTDIPVLELLDTGGTQLQGVTIDASGTIAGGGEPLANGTRIALVGNDNGIVADATLSETTGTLRQGFRWITVSGWKAMDSVSMRC